MSVKNSTELMLCYMFVKTPTLNKLLYFILYSTLTITPPMGEGIHLNILIRQTIIN